jgi:hypothetical protein
MEHKSSESNSKMSVVKASTIVSLLVIASLVGYVTCVVVGLDGAPDVPTKITAIIPIGNFYWVIAGPGHGPTSAILSSIGIFSQFMLLSLILSRKMTPVEESEEEAND